MIETYQDCKAEENDIGKEVSRLGETAGLRLKAARVCPYLIIHEYGEYFAKGSNEAHKSRYQKVCLDLHQSPKTG